MSTLTIQGLLNNLNSGFPCRRITWEEGDFIFKQSITSVEKSTIPRMTSLSDQVKSIFEKRDLDSIHYCHQIVKVNKYNVITSFAFSVEELYAGDWIIQN